MSAKVLPPPFDPAIERALEEFSDSVVCSMQPEDLAAVRKLTEVVPVNELTLHGKLDRALVEAETPAGKVPLTIYYPTGLKKPAPYLVHLHGGGMLVGTPDSDVVFINQMATHFGLAVVSVDYRLAPEDPYPCALNDAVNAIEWVRQSQDLNLDHTFSLLTGLSAGGGLAAAVALYQRDNGMMPFDGVMLMCPMLDQRNDSESATQMRGIGSWDQIANATAWSLYLGGTEVDQYASAALATSLAGLPPVFIDVGSAETFREECVEFARRIWMEGGQAELHVWPGGCHAFDYLAPWAALSSDARATRLAWLRRLMVSK